ncbi:MAG: hypothetical protein AAF985_00610 [Bacteroidota bacterium]
MTESKLLQLIFTLKEEELNRLELFLASKFLNLETQPKKTNQLFQHIKKTLLEKEKGDWDQYLSRERVFPMLFPGEPFLSRKLEKIMSKLFQVIKSFVVLEFSGIRDNEIYQLLTLSRFYRERGLYQQFDLNMKKLKRLQQQTIQHDEDYFKYQYEIEKEIGEKESFYNNRKSDVNLTRMLDDLELWQLIQKLKLMNQIYLQKIHTNITLSTPTIQPEDIDRLLAERPEWDFPILKIHYHAFKLLYAYPDDNIEALEKLRTLLRKNECNLPSSEVYQFQSLIRTFTIKKHNEGNQSYLPLAFKIYKEHLQAGYLYPENQIHKASFINIVILGLKLNEVTWVAQFIQQYTDRIIGAKNPQAIVAFTLGLLHFTNKEYDKALDLVHFDYEDISLKIATKRLEIKIYYEQDSSLLEHRLDAFKVYIFRLGKKHLTPREKLANNNFIDVIRQIIHNKTLLNTERINKISKKTEQVELLADREWLSEQVRQLK